MAGPKAWLTEFIIHHSLECGLCCLFKVTSSEKDDKPGKQYLSFFQKAASLQLIECLAALMNLCRSEFFKMSPREISSPITTMQLDKTSSFTCGKHISPLFLQTPTMFPPPSKRIFSFLFYNIVNRYRDAKLNNKGFVTIHQTFNVCNKLQA